MSLAIAILAGALAGLAVAAFVSCGCHDPRVWLLCLPGGRSVSLNPITLKKIDDVASATAELTFATEALDVAERRLADDAAADPDRSFPHMLERLSVQNEKTIEYIVAGRPAPPSPPPGRAVRVVFRIGQVQGENMGAIVKATDPVKNLSVSFKDSEGNPAKVDGVPVWGQSDPAIGTLTPSEDGLSATLDPGSPIAGQITVTGDADTGAGVVPVVGTLDIEIVAGDAAVAEISIS